MHTLPLYFTVLFISSDSFVLNLIVLINIIYILRGWIGGWGFVYCLLLVLFVVAFNFVVTCLAQVPLPNYKRAPHSGRMCRSRKPV